MMKQITVDLEDTIRRWIRQGCTDDWETQVDDYGKRLLRAVLTAAGCDEGRSGERGDDDDAETR
jgi:hypothetical protein